MTKRARAARAAAAAAGALAAAQRRALRAERDAAIRLVITGGYGGPRQRGKLVALILEANDILAADVRARTNGGPR